MSKTVEETIFITEDTYVSSAKSSEALHDEKLPLLNVGQSEYGNVNRGLFKVDFGDLSGKKIEEAKLCLYQILAGNRASASDTIYIHAVNTEWSEDFVTWDSLGGASSLGTLISTTSSLSTEKQIKVCFKLDPNEVATNKYGYIMKGEEGSDKHDRWFRASEYTAGSKDVYTEASSDLYHPHVILKATVDPNYVRGGAGSGSRTGLIVGLTTGFVALALLSVLGFIFVRRRRDRYDDEESSIESEEPPKDFIDNVGEVFGVTSSSEDDEDETMYTRDVTAYDNETEMSYDYTYDDGRYRR